MNSLSRMRIADRTSSSGPSHDFHDDAKEFCPRGGEGLGSGRGRSSGVSLPEVPDHRSRTTGDEPVSTTSSMSSETSLARPASDASVKHNANRPSGRALSG